MNRPMSMTSFGRGEKSGANRNWVVEIRSVNHRFCDIKVKMPREYNVLEEKIKKTVAAAISRGHIEVAVTVSGQSSANNSLEVNIPLAQAYFDALQTIQKTLKVQGPPTLEMVAANRDLISRKEDSEDMDEAWEYLNSALQEALNVSEQMRIEEGNSLKVDLMERLDLFESTVQEIDAIVPELILKKEAALNERLEKLLKNVDLDPLRLAQEVAIIADKSDITEEIVRLKSHIEQFKGFMELDEPVGRRLDFLLQEFLREINTTASKINDATTTHKTVTLKNEVEKMKEQVQNIE